MKGELSSGRAIATRAAPDLCSAAPPCHPRGMDLTPILVGAGQFTERIGDELYRGLSPVELAAEAARLALADGQGRGLAAAIDAIATTRTFEDSMPWPTPFGKSANFPRSIAQRLGLQPRLAYWSEMGGNTPQQLVNRFAERLARGELQAVLLAGAEAISTVRHLSASGQTRDWREAPLGQVDDGGRGWDDLLTPAMAAHRLANIPAVYGLLENARRARLGQSRAAYAQHMGELFAPLSARAAGNPYSATAQHPATAAELATPSARNRMIADPYPLHLVARDQVNQAAALVLTTVAKARALGIDDQRWVFLHGYADLHERPVLERPDLGAYPAGVAATKAALEAAGVGAEQLAHLDFYSCFPIAVSSIAVDALGLSPADPRGLSATGGLPYFGGPGNNYSMHAIATMVELLRATPGEYGFVGANGGFLSKYSAGVYSTAPTPWKPCDSADLQARLDAAPCPDPTLQAGGDAILETATVVFAQGQPAYAIAVGRMDSDDGRFFALSPEGDSATAAQLYAEESRGRAIAVKLEGGIRRFCLKN
jgi:acetyl-CoA C-acetyltransferase